MTPDPYIVDEQPQGEIALLTPPDELYRYFKAYQSKLFDYLIYEHPDHHFITNKVIKQKLIQEKRKIREEIHNLDDVLLTLEELIK